MSNPVTQRILPAGIMGGQEAAMEAVQGEPIDPTKVAISAGAGALMNRPTALGERLLGYGAAPVRAVIGPGAAPTPAATPLAGASPAGTALPPPPVGSVIGMDLGRGVAPATVARHEANGDVVLTDPEGQEHRMTGADVARFGTAAPSEEGAPGAPRTTVDVNGQRVADTHGPVPTAEAIRNAHERGETITTPQERPRTQADIDRESAEMRSAEARAALVGQAAPAADPLAQAQAPSMPNSLNQPVIPLWNRPRPLQRRIPPLHPGQKRPTRRRNPPLRHRNPRHQPPPLRRKRGSRQHQHGHPLSI